MDTNPPEDHAPVIPFDTGTPTPAPIQTTRARLATWHAATTVAAAHAGTEAHKPQLLGIRFTPADPADPTARFTMTTTDAFALARVTVTPYEDGRPTVSAVIPAKEFAAAVTAAVKAHGRKAGATILGTLDVDHEAARWTFSTQTTSATGPTIPTDQFPRTDQLAEPLDNPSTGTEAYLPTGYDPELLTNLTNTARKIGASLIEWHHWQAPTKPVAIRYTAGDVTADVLLMPKRIR